MKKNVVALLFLVATLAAPAVDAAEDKIADVTDMQALRTAIRADRKAFVDQTLKLTDTQARKFWPVYDAYQRSLDAANRRRVVAVEALITRDKPITELYAKQLASELIGADEAELKARRTLHNRVLRILPPVKAARYLQLESKIRAVQAYDIASTIPLVR
jgi:Spy/CpxP family protein refolding chaperone